MRNASYTSSDPQISVVIIIIFRIQLYFHDILHITSENVAQHINGMCGNVHIFLQSSNLSGADTIVFDQAVLADIRPFHGFPQPVITDHLHHSFNSIKALITVYVYYPKLGLKIESNEKCNARPPGDGAGYRRKTGKNGGGSL